MNQNEEVYLLGGIAQTITEKLNESDPDYESALLDIQRLKKAVEAVERRVIDKIQNRT